MPQEYVYYRWRKLMHASYEDLCNTPLWVIMRDLEFDKYESQVQKAKSDSQSAK